jgi:protein-tyrosine phosphatase
LAEGVLVETVPVQSTVVCTIQPVRKTSRTIIRVLFVCLGNICRSPMAEAVFIRLVREAGLQDKIEAASAGTADWEIDSAPHPGTLYILEQNGIEYSGQGRKLSKADLHEFDYIVTMDDENLRHVHKLGQGRARVAPLMSFVMNTDIREVPDPYFNNGFEIVYMLVRAGSEGLLTHIRREYQLP